MSGFNPCHITHTDKKTITGIAANACRSLLAAVIASGLFGSCLRSLVLVRASGQEI